jgi:hypothetical protein
MMRSFIATSIDDALNLFLKTPFLGSQTGEIHWLPGELNVPAFEEADMGELLSRLGLLQKPADLGANALPRLR